MTKEYICISGLNLRDNNRGTAALGYGSFTFLQKKGMLHPGQELINFRIVLNPLKKENRGIKSNTIKVNDSEWVVKTVNVSKLIYNIFICWGILMPFSNFRKYVKQLKLVAAINGGDGFSDIYDTKAFQSRLTETKVAMRAGIPLVLLPQTVGPFNDKCNYDIAFSILRYANKVYIRDEKYIEELRKSDIAFEIEKDLSYYMVPEPWDIDIVPAAIGINVSGLAYSNNFRALSGQFDCYPELIDQLIHHFTETGHTVYLIPHSYNYQTAEVNNDDLEACRLAYNRLTDKDHVQLIDKDMTPPQVKYLISRMSFFIGTRMHANFAAIFTNVPLFGLAYSYKFEGAFASNGLDGKKQLYMINNMKSSDIPAAIAKVMAYYSSVC